MNHAWVQITYVPVDIELDESSGALAILASPEAIETAHEHGVVICYFCETDLTSESFAAECVDQSATQNIDQKP